MKIENDPYLKQVVDNADMVLVDGKPLVWISKLHGKPLKAKISGSDLVPLLCEVAAQKNYTIFIIGGKEGIAEQAKRKASLIPVLALVLFYIFRNGINLKLKVIGRLVCGLIAFWGFIAFSVSNGWAYKTYGYRIYGLLTYLGNNADLTDGSVKSLMTRSSLASIAKDNIVHNFPFPIGVGNFASLSTYPHAHNNYFELLLTLGILGFLCYYAMFFYITRKAWKVRKRPEGVFVIVCNRHISSKEKACCAYLYQCPGDTKLCSRLDRSIL